MKYCLIRHWLANHWPFVSLYSKNEFQSIRHCVFGNSSSPLSKHPLSDFEKSKVRCRPCSCGIDTRWSNLVTRSCSWWMVYKPDDTSQHNFGRVCKWSIYREYFIEIAGVRYLRTSCWRIINRTSEHSERVRFLLQRQRVRKYRTRHFPCGIVFTPFPKSRASYFRFARFNTSLLCYLRAWRRLIIYILRQSSSFQIFPKCSSLPLVHTAKWQQNRSISYISKNVG